MAGLDYDIFDNTWKMTIDSKLTLSGRRWSDISNRCNTGGAFQKLRPSYVGCSNEFGDFQSFVKWSVNQVGYDLKDSKGRKWQLDKDLILHDNKVYSDKTCVFVPSEVNNFLIACDTARGDLPLGVTRNNKTGYTSQCQSGEGKQLRFSGFHCPYEAHRKWQETKLVVGNRIVEKYSELAPIVSQAVFARLEILKSQYDKHELTLKL